jgi:hypothetical protein
MRISTVYFPLACIIALMWMTANAASAQTASASPATELFSRGYRTLDFTGQYIQEVTNKRDDQLAGGSVGLSYYLFDRTAVVVQVPFYDVERSGPDTVAGGFTLLARYHFLEVDQWSLFIDGGAGALLAGSKVPAGGTNFNFTPQTGLGFTYRLNNNLDLIAGTHFFHLSNAGLDGGNHNPGINGAMEGYAGLMFKF